MLHDYGEIIQQAIIIDNRKALLSTNADAGQWRRVLYQKWKWDPLKAATKLTKRHRKGEFATIPHAKAGINAKRPHQARDDHDSDSTLLIVVDDSKGLDPVTIWRLIPNRLDEQNCPLPDIDQTGQGQVSICKDPEGA